MKNSIMQFSVAVLAILLSGMLAGCGGEVLGGGTDGGTGTTGVAVLSLSLTDPSGAATVEIASDRAGTLQASVKDGKGAGVPSVAVSFTTSDATGVFVPASGTALTDASGNARVALLAGSQAGGFTARASALVNGTATTGNIGYAVTAPIPGAASLTLTLTDSAGVGISQIAPDRAATLLALVKDDRGAVVPNVAVTFATNDTTGAFVPASGTALTNASGLARVSLPAGAQSGGFTVRANAVVNGATTSGTAGYAVAFPTLTLSALTITPATLSAGGNASISVAVSSGSSPYLPPLPVVFSSPCVTAGKATLGSPVLTQNGVASASYSDRGCGVADRITASVALGDATVVAAGSVDVLPAGVGSIKFVNADTSNISLRGTGGFGRQEFSTLKFEVSDTTGNKVAGKLVDFVFSDSNSARSVGGLTLNPTFATSAADGTVTTLVTAGVIPTSVRVVATIRGSAPLLTTLSNILVASTGVPDQSHMSLSTEVGNCEGLEFDQPCSIVTVTLGDHFSNPAPDGTAVNFSAEGGVIDASCVTGSLPPPGATPPGQTTNSKVGPGSGACSVLLRSGNPRPTDGRVTVLAYALGEETFFDANGNNAFDAGEPHTDKSPDIHRDDDESQGWSPGESCVGPNSNGSCLTPGDGQYNGVLRVPQVSSAQTLYVSDQLVQIFSGSHASIDFNPPALVCPASGTVDVQVRVTDQLGNIMPARTTIGFSTLFARCLESLCTVSPTGVKVNNIVLAVAEPLLIPTYLVTAKCQPGDSGKFTVKVTTPNGVESEAKIPFN